MFLVMFFLVYRRVDIVQALGLVELLVVDQRYLWADVGGTSTRAAIQVIDRVLANFAVTRPSSTCSYGGAYLGG